MVGGRVSGEGLGFTVWGLDFGCLLFVYGGLGFRVPGFRMVPFNIF